MGRPILILGFAAVLTLSCTKGATEAVDPWMHPVSIDAAGPSLLLPGTTIRVTGGGFIHPDFGENQLHWVGVGPEGPFDVILPATYIDEGHLEASFDPAEFASMGGTGSRIRGDLRVEVFHSRSASNRASAAVAYDVSLERQLTPAIASLETNTDVYINDEITIGGAGFLLDGDEGQTVARVHGCFFPGGDGPCVGVKEDGLPFLPSHPTDRTEGHFVFSFKITGLRPGVFRGTVQLDNVHGDGTVLSTEAEQLELSVQPAAITGIGTPAASLGQYVDIDGGGFVGGDDSSVTLLEVSGTFQSQKTGQSRSIDLLLVPEFQTGRRVRYVLNEEDGLGTEINLRREFGTLTGNLRPVTRYGEEEQRGQAVPFTFEIAPVTQPVVIFFHPSYTESLGRFGLRAVDDLVRERALAAAMEPYQGVRVLFETDIPEEFALYSVVEISGEDPNGQGLFGYDNSPGKDTNNLRLHDRIGGVNAQTQEDGFPGFGGVFIESFFEFRKGGAIESPYFDRIFNDFRPSKGGSPVGKEDLDAGIPVLTDGTICTGGNLDRRRAIACAVWTLGNLIGSTLSHEVGHSLGLANPYEPMSFHNPGDEPLRLMDSGGARPFEERADLEGKGTAHFCEEEYEYLRELMPDGAPDLRERPRCY